MTRELRNFAKNRIEYLLKISPFVFDECDRGALVVAIQALSLEPCDDVVSRILKRMWNWRGKHTTSIDKVAMEQIIRDELPPVTPKPETVTEFADRCRECGKMRKGHWIYDKTIENWRCSKCNETPKTMGYVGTADFMTEHFKFCNHCGAKMQVESDIKQGLNYADEDTLMSAT